MADDSASAPDNETAPDLIALTADIVSAHAARNILRPDSFPR